MTQKHIATILDLLVPQAEQFQMRVKFEDEYKPAFRKAQIARLQPKIDAIEALRVHLTELSSQCLKKA